LVTRLALVVFVVAMAPPAFAQLQKKRTPPPAVTEGIRRQRLELSV
jgi:hypothetical protein